jgi:hypothetical protein
LKYIYIYKTGINIFSSTVYSDKFCRRVKVKENCVPNCCEETLSKVRVLCEKRICLHLDEKTEVNERKEATVIIGVLKTIESYKRISFIMQ